MAIAHKLCDDIDKQLFKAQTIIIELKCATRYSTQIKENCVRQKVSYSHLLDILFPELASFLGSPSAKHDSYIYEVLKEFPSASKLSTAHLTKLTNLISAHSRGRFGKEHAVKLKQLAYESIGTISPPLKFELLQTINVIEYFSELRKAADIERNRNSVGRFMEF